MAKNKTNQTHVLLPTIPQNVQGTISLTAGELTELSHGEDLIRVMMVRGRKLLQQREQELREQLKNQEKQLVDAWEIARQAAIEQASGNMEDAVGAAKKLCKSLGIKKSEIVISSPEFVVEPSDREEKKYTYFTVQFKIVSDGRGLLSYSKLLRSTANTSKLCEECNEIQEQIQSTKQSFVDVKRELAALPSYREELEAMLAESRLSASTVGSELLDRWDWQLSENSQLKLLK